MNLSLDFLLCLGGGDAGPRLALVIGRIPVALMDLEDGQKHGRDCGYGDEAELHQPGIAGDNSPDGCPLQPEAEVGQDGKVIQDLIEARGLSSRHF